MSNTNSNNVKVVTMEVFKKVFEKTLNAEKENRNFQFPDLKLTINDALEFFSNDEHCRVILKYSKNPKMFLEIIGAANPEYIKNVFSKPEKLKEIQGLKFEDYVIFSPKILAGPVGEFFLDMAANEKKVKKIPKESWIIGNDKYIFKAINSGLRGVEDLLLIKWDENNSEHINFIKEMSNKNNAVVLKIIPVKMFENKSLLAYTLINGLKRGDYSVIECMFDIIDKNNAKETEVFKNTISLALTQNPMVMRALTNHFGVDYTKQFNEEYLQGLKDNKIDGSYNILTFNAIEEIVKEINTIKDLMFYVRSYPETFLQSEDMMKKINMRMLWDSTKEGNDTEKLLNLVDSKNKFFQVVSQWFENPQNMKEAKEFFEKNNLINTEPLNISLETIFGADYVNAYFKNKDSLVKNQLFRESEWLLSNMDSKAFHEAMIKTVGSYKEVGKMLAYDACYDDVTQRYEFVMGMSDREFVDLFVENVEKQNQNKVKKSLNI